MTDNRDQMYSMERYRLVFAHEIIDKNGCRHQLEEPIVCNYYLTPTDKMRMSRPIILNEMLEKMTEYVLGRADSNDNN